MLSRESAGELEASRFAHSGGIAHWLQCLDDLARQVGDGGRALTPSRSWEGYVERMTAFRQAHDTHLTEGERLRTELFARTLDADHGAAKVADWLSAGDESFSTVTRLRAGLRSSYPAGTFPTYEGMSDEQSKNVWRLDVRLLALQPLLAVVGRYVQALSGT